MSLLTWWNGLSAAAKAGVAIGGAALVGGGATAIVVSSQKSTGAGAPPPPPPPPPVQTPDPVTFDAGERYIFALTFNQPIGTRSYEAVVQTYLDSLTDMSGVPQPGVFRIVPPVLNAAAAGGGINQKHPARGSATNVDATADCTKTITLNFLPVANAAYRFDLVVSAASVIDEGASPPSILYDQGHRYKFTSLLLLPPSGTDPKTYAQGILDKMPGVAPGALVVQGAGIAMQGGVVASLVFAADCLTSTTADLPGGLAVTDEGTANFGGCPSGKVMDVGTGECVGKCWDGSAPISGVCPDSWTVDPSKTTMSISISTGSFSVYPPPGASFVSADPEADVQGQAPPIATIQSDGSYLVLFTTGNPCTVAVTWMISGTPATCTISFG